MISRFSILILVVFPLAAFCEEDVKELENQRQSIANQLKIAQADLKNSSDKASGNAKIIIVLKDGKEIPARGSMKQDNETVIMKLDGKSESIKTESIQEIKAATQSSTGQAYKDSFARVVSLERNLKDIEEHILSLKTADQAKKSSGSIKERYGKGEAEDIMVQKLKLKENVDPEIKWSFNPKAAAVFSFKITSKDLTTTTADRYLAIKKKLEENLKDVFLDEDYNAILDELKAQYQDHASGTPHKAAYKIGVKYMFSIGLERDCSVMWISTEVLRTDR
jgi:hypothetical protein